MTAVCYKDGILATDSQCTTDDTLTYFDKMQVCKTKQKGFAKVAIARSGENFEGQSWVNWWVSGKKQMPDHRFEGNIFVMGKKKIMIIRESLVVEHSKIDGEYIPWAFGSATPHILTGLDMGLNAVDCVKLACKRDVGCGGDILWVDRREMKIHRIKYSGGWDNDE